MSRCKHPRHKVFAMVHPDYVKGIGEFFLHRHECTKCGEVLPLGPSKDTKAVLIEIRAAEIADAMDMTYRLSAKTWMTLSEATGWRGQHFTQRLKVGEYLAGYLADQIANQPTLRLCGLIYEV